MMTTGNKRLDEILCKVDKSDIGGGIYPINTDKEGNAPQSKRITIT